MGLSCSSVWLHSGYRVCVVHCLDSLFVTDSSRLISGMLMCKYWVAKDTRDPLFDL